MVVPLPPTPRPARDLVIGVILGLAFGLASLSAARSIPITIAERHNRDVWFQTAADSLVNLAGDRQHSRHGRNNIHPFFSLVAHPPIPVLHRLFGIDVLTGLRLVVAGVACLWGLSLILLLRLMRCQSLDAVLVTALAMVSASAVFLFTIPDLEPVERAWNRKTGSACRSLTVVEKSASASSTIRWYAADFHPKGGRSPLFDPWSDSRARSARYIRAAAGLKHPGVPSGRLVPGRRRLYSESSG